MSHDEGDRWDALAAELFALCDSRTRATYLHAGDAPKKRDALLQFARLLAAYYLDFGAPPAGVAELPNLFRWAENSTRAAYGVFECKFPRETLAALTSELTPGAVTRIFCATGAWLEAIFFVDHFDDFRAQILLRRIVDVNFGLDLFGDHCERHLSTALLERLCGDVSNDALGLVALTRRHVDTLVQLDVVFGGDFVTRLKHDAQCRINDALAGLQDDDVDQRVQLPRPPIYATPSQQGDSGLAELRAWNVIHRLIHLLLACLARSNSLEPLVAGVVAWILRARQTTADSNDVVLPYHMEGELASDGVSDEDRRLFARLIFCVLQMSLRDRISIFWRHHGDMVDDAVNDTTHDEFEILEQKYASLFASVEFDENNIDSGRFEDSDEMSAADGRTSPERLLQRWMYTAMNEDDVTQLLNFMQFAKAAHPQHERYLPVINDASITKWRTTLLSQILTSKYIEPSRFCDDETTNLRNEDKISVDHLELRRLRFITDALPTVSRLDDPSLIGISLRLNADAFVCCDELLNNKNLGAVEPATVSDDLASKQSIKYDDNLQQMKDDPIAVITTPNDALLTRIRASIRRLGEMRDAPTGPTSTANEQNTAFKDFMTDFQLEQLRVEINALRQIVAAPCTSRAVNVGIPTTSTTRSLPAKLNASAPTQIYQNKTTRSKIKSENYSSQDSHSKNKLKQYNDRKEETDKNTVHNTSRMSQNGSGRYSDGSSASLTLSSERLRAEIDEIGRRLSKLRKDLRAPTPPPPMHESDSDSTVSDDSALEPSAPPSAHSVAPLDLSALNSSRDERAVEPPTPAWTDLTVYPRPKRGKKVKTIKQSNEELPHWLRLLPPQRYRSCTKGRLQFKNNAMNYEKQSAVLSLQYDAPVLFASEMTREEINALLQRANKYNYDNHTSAVP